MNAGMTATMTESLTSSLWSSPQATRPNRHSRAGSR
jgi:hypothetical protein